MAKRVVITGLGPVTSAGIGKKEFFCNLWRQQLTATRIPPQFTRSYALHSQWYVPLPDVSLTQYHISLPHENAMHAEDRMVVLGAKLAFEDAGYPVVSADGRMMVPGIDAASVVLGTGVSGMRTALESHLGHCLPRELLQSTLPERRFAFNRMVVPKTMPNSPAAWASICFGISGPSHTVNASCASGTYAIGEAFRCIKDGYSELVLTGGVESLQDCDGFIMRGFDVLGVLTQSPEGRPNPFGQQRSGFLFAEGGACLLIMEELEHALRRQAPIYAEVADFRSNSDACNIVQIDPEGRQIIQLLQELSASVKIDYLNTHGTGTVANDEVEARAIQTAFGDKPTQPWLNSTKGILGHTLGSSGAIEAAVAALSVFHGTVHANRTEDPMENLNLPLETVNSPIEHALSVSYGFGGHNGGLLLKRYEHHR